MNDFEKPAANPQGPLELPERRLELLDLASAREIGQYTPDIGYSARVWAQVSLPYREPKGVPYWERRNGDVTLTVRPALLTDPTTRVRYEAYPFGVLPRHALTWMATEALLTQSPVLELGRSQNAFMEKLGLSHNGRNAKRLTEHMQRLFGSQLSVEGLAITENGHGVATQYFQIADSVQLWFTNRDEPENSGLWSSQVTLSDRFFRSIVDHPVPVDLKVLKKLGSSPMRIDQYIWLTYRMSYLREPTRIKWADLDTQFGSQFGRTRAFKEAFIKNLEDMQILYDGLNVEVTRDHLILRPGKTSIPKRPKRIAG